MEPGLSSPFTLTAKGAVIQPTEWAHVMVEPGNRQEFCLNINTLRQKRDSNPER
jgi:hypothetical protein